MKTWQIMVGCILGIALVLGIMAYSTATKDTTGTFGILAALCAVIGWNREARMAMTFFVVLYGGGLLFSMAHTLGIAWPSLACLAYWVTLFIAAYKAMIFVFRYQRKQENDPNWRGVAF